VKILDWQWRLETGVVVRARLELPSKVESVWVGDQLVSRRRGADRPDGDIVPIGEGSGGAYRSGAESRVVFDTFGDALGTCDLSLEGRTMPASCVPTSSRVPRRPAWTIPLAAVGGSLVLALAVTGARSLPSLIAARPTASLAVSIASPPSSSASAGPTESDQGIARLRPAFRRCYEGGLSEDPWMVGSATVVARVGPGGKLVWASIDDNRGLSAGVAQCMLDVVRHASFPGGPEATVHVPVRFIPAHSWEAWYERASPGDDAASPGPGRR
jgi:hypothetical protein